MTRGNISRGMSQKHIKNNLRVHLGPYAYRSHSIKMQTEIAANSQLPTFKSNKLGSIPDLGSADPGLTCFYFPDCDRPFQKHREVNWGALLGPMDRVFIRSACLTFSLLFRARRLQQSGKSDSDKTVRLRPSLVLKKPFSSCCRAPSVISYYGISNWIVQQLHVLSCSATINYSTNGLSMQICLWLQLFYVDLCTSRQQQHHRNVFTPLQDYGT